MGGVALSEVCAVDAEEDKCGVAQTAHEGDAQFVGAHDGEEEIFVLLADECLLRHIADESVGCPVFGDGRKEAVGVSFVVPVWMMVLRTPDDDALMMGQRLIVEVVCCGSNAEETQIVIGSSELLALGKLEIRLGYINSRGERCAEDEKEYCQDEE